MRYTLRTAAIALACGIITGGLHAQTTSSAPAHPAASGTQSSGAAHTGSATTSHAGGASAQSGAENVPPAHPLTIEQTRELLSLMDFRKNMDNMLNQTISMQKQQAPFVPDDVWTDFQATFQKVDYVTLLQPVYAKYLSQEDATKSLEFYRTAAGKHMLEVMPMLYRDMIVTSQQNGQKLGREVIDRHRAEIDAAQKKYQQDQQKSAPASGGGAAGSGNGAAGGETPSTRGTAAPSGSNGGSPSTTPAPPASSTTPNAGSTNTQQPH